MIFYNPTNCNIFLMLKKKMSFLIAPTKVYFGQFLQFICLLIHVLLINFSPDNYWKDIPDFVLIFKLRGYKMQPSSIK